jgi:murein DD-endopeptidase MepM/ murein hydrolase activator NlpD
MTAATDTTPGDPVPAGRVARVIADHQHELAPVIPDDLSRTRPVILDLGAGNQKLADIDTSDTSAFTEYVFAVMAAQGAQIGIGRYNENRVIYRHSTLFDGEAESRTIHLGVDLFVASGTPVRAPLPARVHSFANNTALGDYGPTIILEHMLEETTFFTLYGHLSIDSLAGLSTSREVAAGARIGAVGPFPENGGWPPHLHFQIITDMLGKSGDFPGVAPISQRARYLGLCPDPGLILRL